MVAVVRAPRQLRLPHAGPRLRTGADPVAYRRDRSKDRFLQQNGYFVLRFLADDVGKELDLVLDSVLRTVARRRS
jgi:very-short-patch-repair endonuclease